MILDLIVHKSSVSVDVGGGGKDGKVFSIGVLENNPRPTVDTGASLVDQYPITLVHIVGFKIIKNRTNIF